MAEENEGSFKVTDRRLFNPDGTLRDEAPAEKEASTAAPLEPATESTSLPTSNEPPTFDLTEGDPNSMQDQTMFTEFLMGIASSVFIYLGLVEHPATGRRQVDLTAAKESIDMLSMLRDKTKGNLTGGEEKFFDDLLADLRMQFVSMRR
jgi:hypothetical protein